MTELSPEIRSVVEKVEKLLRLAAANSNEAEAAAATAKAQDLLTAYNLDMALVERNSGGTGKRAEEYLEGGFYDFERDLWDAVAGLNFCLYWNQKHCTGHTYTRDGYLRSKYVRKHNIVGRTVNIAATKAMATYLQQASERLAKQRCEARGIRINSKWAVSYRRGIADRLVAKIYERRRHVLAEEKRAKMDAEAAARNSAREGVSTDTALTISTYVDAEHDANIDFAFGDGTSAKWAADRAEKAAAARAAEEAYTKWAAANPEEAAAEEEKRQKEQRRKAERASKKGGTNYDAAYFTGYDAGEAISIDPQTEGFKSAGALQ